MSPYQTLKEEAWEANLELPKQKVVIYTFGNVSAAHQDRAVFAIKPSGVPYENLKAQDMVVVDFEGKIVEGTLNPSSDTKTHAVLYQQFSKMEGIVHTHSTYATAWAQAQKPVPILGTTHADHLATDIPCTAIMSDEAIRGDYEIATGYQILDVFKTLNYEEVPMVLVAGHGPFAWGATAKKAVYHAVVMEELAKMAFVSLQINPSVSQLKASLIEKHYLRKHGKDAYYGQSTG